MRFFYCLTLATLVATAGCKSEGEKYTLTPDQLAWQPYTQGQLLRFGNQRTTMQRTYQITKVVSVMEEYGGFYLGFGKGRPQFQHVTATAVRTDSATASGTFEALDLDLSDGFHSAESHFRAAGDWDYSGRARLPINEANIGLTIDTLMYPEYSGVKILANFPLGQFVYDRVIRSPLGYGPAKAVYYAKKYGVVAFEDKRTGLWYRLP